MPVIPRAVSRRLNDQAAALGLELRDEDGRWQLHQGRRLLVDCADVEEARLFLLQYGAVANFCKPLAMTEAPRPDRKIHRGK